MAKENKGTVPTQGSDNYSSDETKEIARLQRKLCDTKDVLEVLKKAIFTTTSEYVKKLNDLSAR